MYLLCSGPAQRPYVGAQCSAPQRTTSARQLSRQCQSAWQHRVKARGAVTVAAAQRAWHLRVSAVQTAEAPQECGEAAERGGYGMTVADLARFSEQLAEQARTKPARCTAST